MISVKGASFGRFGGWRRRYPGGSECRSIFLTVSRAMPNRLAASRCLRPSTWQASRTRRYRSTVYILPPSISKKIEGYRWAEFYSARGWEIPPLPWTNLSPPFSLQLPFGFDPLAAPIGAPICPSGESLGSNPSIVDLDVKGKNLAGIVDRTSPLGQLEMATSRSNSA